MYVKSAGSQEAILRITGEVEQAMLSGDSLYSAAMDLSASHHAGDSEMNRDVVNNFESARHYVRMS